MRIFQVINNFGLDRGGAERLARQLHLDLRDQGVEAHIIGLEGAPDPDLPGSYALGLHTPRDPRALPRLRRQLAGRLGPGDIVHAHLFPATAHVSLLRRTGLLRAPCTMTEHNTWNRRRGHAAGRMLDRAIYAGYARIIAISDATKAALLDTHPQLAARTDTVVNGATLAFASPPPRDLDPAEPTIISVGRLAHAKNLDTALRALQRLAHLPWRYVIVGDGPERPALTALAEELGLADRVSFSGHVRDVADRLAAADLFLMPSRWDGFGLAAVEAMNAALPVVAADVPGLREVVGPSGAPLVSPDDPAALADAVAGLLQNAGLRQTLGQQGFTQSLHFSTERMARDYVQIWQSMTGQAA